MFCACVRAFSPLFCRKLDPTSLEDQKGSNRTVDVSILIDSYATIHFEWLFSLLYTQILKFPGLHKAGRCVPLPGKLEALSILNTVTKCANIPVSTLAVLMYLFNGDIFFQPRVMKPWKRVFFCNTSSSILQVR